MTPPPEAASLGKSLPSHPKSKSKSLHSSPHAKEGCSNTLDENTSHNDSHRVPEQDDDDWTSPSASSSENESDDDDDSDNDEHPIGPNNISREEDEDDDGLTVLRPFPKSAIKFTQNSDLRDRLSQFIPALKAANEELERDIAAGNTRSVEIGQEENENEGEGQGRYIEMDLGLGVLEEKKGIDVDTESSDEDLDEEMTGQEPQETKKRTQKSKNVLGKLLGEERKSKKPTIEEMDR